MEKLEKLNKDNYWIEVVENKLYQVVLKPDQVSAFFNTAFVKQFFLVLSHERDNSCETEAGTWLTKNPVWSTMFKYYELDITLSYKFIRAETVLAHLNVWDVPNYILSRAVNEL